MIFAGVCMRRRLFFEGDKPMYYCAECCRVWEGDRCPCCGKTLMSPPHPRDFCLLLEKEAMWADMLREVLQDQGIPCVHKPLLGAAMAMSLGGALERYQLYVPYENLLEAKIIAEQLFETPAEGDEPL